MVFETVWLCIRLAGRAVELMWLYLPLVPLGAAVWLANTLRCGRRCRQGLLQRLGVEREKEDFSAVWWNVALRRMQKSGPVFVKLGQWAATREDLVPKAWCQALGRLHDKTEPHDLNHTHKVLNAAFPKSKWYQRFLIEPEPIGSGCIAQVYAGFFLPDEERPPLRSKNVWEGWQCFFLPAERFLRPITPNRTVKIAVKVVHPQVRRAVDLDLIVLKALAWIADRLGFEGLGASLALRQFAAFLSSQADLTIEADNLRKFRANFSTEGEDAPIVPQVYDQWVSQDAIVMSYEEGMPLNTLLEARKDDCKANLLKLVVWQQIVDAFWAMVFRHQLVHGDMHPGNVLWRRQNGGRAQLVLLDCGLAINLQGNAGKDLTKMVKAILTQDENDIGLLLIELGNRVGGRPEDVRDPEGFARSIGALVREARGCTYKLSKLNAAGLMGQSLLLGRRHCVRFDARFVNLAISMAVLQGVAMRLNGDGDFLSRMRPYLFGAAVAAARRPIWKFCQPSNKEVDDST